MGTYKTYILGFLLSIVMTLAAYFDVVYHIPHVLPIILSIAIVQVFVQLFFFLHLGSGPNYRWNILVLLFAIMVIGILVGGSLWIMNNLNYNMTPAQMNASMLDQAE
jgi:cytochrome o ubiquinol oxidase operon protein cyoD